MPKKTATKHRSLTTFSANMIEELEPYVKSGGEIHAIVPENESGEPEDDAPVVGYALSADDAELFAAAPMLLGALKIILENEVPSDEDWKRAEAAVKRAEGR